MKVVLGKLAKLGIEVHLRTDVIAGAHEALRHYVRQLDSGQPPLPPPRFLGDWPSEGAAIALELTVDPQTQAALEREACKQSTSMNQILAHAVFLYLADLDAAAGDASTGSDPQAAGRFVSA